jgi:hypothetical protein
MFVVKHTHQLLGIWGEPNLGASSFGAVGCKGKLGVLE